MCLIRRAPDMEEEATAAALRLHTVVMEYLRGNPGCSKRQLRDGVPGDNALIETAFAELCRSGQARYEEPTARGRAGHCYAASDRRKRRRSELPCWTVLNCAGSTVGGRCAGCASPRRGEHQRTPPRILDRTVLTTFAQPEHLDR